MLKGECKYELKNFIKKGGVYYRRNFREYMEVNQYSKKEKDLIYYSNSFLGNLRTGNYKQEYAYNHLAHIIDYRDNYGVKWSKQYTPKGYELSYKDKSQKYCFIFNYKSNKLIRIDAFGRKEIIDTSKCTTISIIDGIDFNDRFITENNSLIEYFIKDLPDKEILKKLLAFKDINIQTKVLDYIKTTRGVTLI